MKIKVNETQYNIEIIGDKVRVNNDKEVMIKQLNSDELIINEKLFHLDYAGEGEWYGVYNIKGISNPCPF
jgi:hypothetical protein